MLQLITTKPGKKYASIKNPRVYEALRRQGMSKERAARISNAQARKRKKEYTLDQLEAFVSSPAYDPAIAGAIALRIPTLPRLKGEQIAPGITRIRGNLCNVHGRYGPCDAGLSKPRSASAGKKPKGRKPRKPKKTEQQREQERIEKRQAREAERVQNRADTLAKMNIAADGQEALGKLRAGEQPDAASVQRHGFEQAGLVERGQDGSYRLTASGRALLTAADSGDLGRAGATIGSARDRTSARTGRQAAAAERKRQAEAKREQAQKLREARLAKQGKGGGKQSTGRTTDPEIAEQRRIRFEQSQQDRADRLARQAKRDAEREQDRSERAKRQAERDRELVEQHGRGAARRESARYGTGRRRRKSFQVFKDARGKWRWVAFSSTAYRDRDGEIVSTKALEDDCAALDKLGHYGPLRWWHVPGLDLGECDFNAMHGRVLIESGTFKSERIARNVATHAANLEISLGFLHAPTDPDADGVFHSIRRFERSLTPRGKASNLFTSFHVKESPVMDETKKSALKSLGFSDQDIADLETRAVQTQKTADDQGVAYKADEPAAVEEITLNGQTYVLKAAPPVVEAEVKDDGEGDMEVLAEDAVVEEELASDPNELTISEGDIAAIGQAVGQAITQALQPLMGLLDIEKKMQGHVQSMMGQYQTQKDAEQAETKEQIEALATTVKAHDDKLTELAGDQPAVSYRPSQAKDNVLTDATLLAAAKAQMNGAGPWDDIISGLGLKPPALP